MEKRIDAGLLLSFYGPALTEKQREMLRLYYEDDLSLSEIADLQGVSRQGVHDAIRRGQTQLLALEEKLGMRARWERLCGELRGCRVALEAGNIRRAMAIIDAVLAREEDQDGI